MNYFIADTHFGHRNVLSFDKRPFDTIEECDNLIIENWNNVIGKFDDIYILGDLSWYKPMKTTAIVEKLNGIKHWIIGNHDYKLLKYKPLMDMFQEIVPYKELQVPEIPSGRPLVLCHYPMPSFNGRFSDGIHLYGHVHTTQDYVDIEKANQEMRGNKQMYNVGCMLPYMNYTPKTLNEILASVKQEYREEG